MRSFQRSMTSSPSRTWISEMAEFRYLLDTNVLSFSHVHLLSSPAGASGISPAA